VTTFPFSVLEDWSAVGAIPRKGAKQYEQNTKYDNVWGNFVAGSTFLKTRKFEMR